MPLSTLQARAVITAAEAKASSMGVPVIIAVVDAGVHLKAFTRMDGAVLGSIDIALKKARTAALFQTNSEAVWEYCKPGAPAPAVELTNGGLAPFAGGVRLRGANGVDGRWHLVDIRSRTGRRRRCGRIDIDPADISGRGTGSAAAAGRLGARCGRHHFDGRQDLTVTSGLSLSAVTSRNQT